MKENVFLIITVNKFPYGDAGAVRLNAFAKIFASKGFVPYVISLGESTNFNESKTEDGIKYISLRYKKHSFFHRIYGRFLFNYNLKKVLKRISNYDICGIFFDSGTSGLFKFLKRFTKKNNLPLVFDDVEWYSPSEFRFGKFDPRYIHNNNINTKFIDKNFKVISISSYLENYFISKNIPTLRIPVIMEVLNTKFNKKKTNNDVINIVYAGSVAGKDYLYEIAEAISMLSSAEQNRLAFNIVGITKEQFEAKYNTDIIKYCGETVQFHGRVSRNEVITFLNNADFSFLLRPENERYAKAGFPTKIVEALSTGTPVLTNATSDLNLYIKDMVNGILIKNCSSKACFEALKTALTLSADEVNNLYAEARKTAVDCFDWRIYSDSFIDFIFN